MKIACLKHVEYEGPAYFPDWATREGYALEEFLVPQDGLPTPGDHDRIIVIGGPMSVWETDRYPWLTREKQFLSQILSGQIPVLGICLGAQLLAEHLGAAVRTGEHKEIGWFDVESTTAARSTWLGDALPPTFQSFFWHGDFFELPAGAVPVASSAAHGVQGFVHGECLGLQFHLEATPTWIRRLVRRDGHELVPGPFIQPAEEIGAESPKLYSESHHLLDRVMKRWLTCGSAQAGESRLRRSC